MHSFRFHFSLFILNRQSQKKVDKKQEVVEKQQILIKIHEKIFKRKTSSSIVIKFLCIYVPSSEWSCVICFNYEWIAEKVHNFFLSRLCDQWTGEGFGNLTALRFSFLKSSYKWKSCDLYIISISLFVNYLLLLILCENWIVK